MPSNIMQDSRKQVPLSWDREPRQDAIEPHTEHHTSPRESDIDSSGPPSPATPRHPLPSEAKVQIVQQFDSVEEQEEHNMTPDQIMHAKILILDLLGWGVPPEYLLDRGVSHKLLCTVFKDLNLRLPENIEADYAAIVNARKAS